MCTCGFSSLVFLVCFRLMSVLHCTLLALADLIPFTYKFTLMYLLSSFTLTKKKKKGKKSYFHINFLTDCFETLTRDTEMISLHIMLFQKFNVNTKTIPLHIIPLFVCLLKCMSMRMTLCNRVKL